MTVADPVATCAICLLPAADLVEPPRRTLARGPDPSDDSFSVTVILPDVPLCNDHACGLRQGDVHLGWCDDERCRAYGEAGRLSACGGEYRALVATKPRCHPSR